MSEHKALLGPLAGLTGPTVRYQMSPNARLRGTHTILESTHTHLGP